MASVSTTGGRTGGLTVCVMLMIATAPSAARSRDRSLDEEVTRGGSGWPPRLFEIDFKGFLAILFGILLAGSEFESLLLMDHS